MAKRYWFRDLRTDKEYVTTAENPNDLARRMNIPKESLQILRARYNVPHSDLILKY